MPTWRERATARASSRVQAGEPLTPEKGKVKARKGSWNCGKGAWGEGTKGAYCAEDDWSEGHIGYNFGYQDTPLWYNDLAHEAADEWQVPKPKTPNKPVFMSVYGSSMPADP